MGGFLVGNQVLLYLKHELLTMYCATDLSKATVPYSPFSQTVIRTKGTALELQWQFKN